MAPAQQIHGLKSDGQARDGLDLVGGLGQLFGCRGGIVRLDCFLRKIGYWVKHLIWALDRFIIIDRACLASEFNAFPLFKFDPSEFKSP